MQLPSPNDPNYADKVFNLVTKTVTVTNLKTGKVDVKKLNANVSLNTLIESYPGKRHITFKEDYDVNVIQGPKEGCDWSINIDDNLDDIMRAIKHQG